MNKKIRIILTDDHSLLRAGLKLLLESRDDLTVVGEASNGREALQLLNETAADILVLDLSMPQMDGIECLHEIQRRHLPLRIIVLTMHNDEKYIKTAMCAGALGYVQKDAVQTELFQAIDTVMQGKRHLGQKETQSLLHSFLAEDALYPDGDNPYKILSAREREVLKQLCQGYLIKQIAENLGLSSKTVDTYKARIMEKLHVTQKNELVSYALRHNLLS